MFILAHLHVSCAQDMVPLLLGRFAAPSRLRRNWMLIALATPAALVSFCYMYRNRRAMVFLCLIVRPHDTAVGRTVELHEEHTAVVDGERGKLCSQRPAVNKRITCPSQIAQVFYHRGCQEQSLCPPPTTCTTFIS